jgi:hypothetical protein
MVPLPPKYVMGDFIVRICGRISHRNYRLDRKLFLMLMFPAQHPYKKSRLLSSNQDPYQDMPYIYPEVQVYIF